MIQSRRKSIKKIGTGLVAIPTIMSSSAILSACGSSGASEQASSATETLAEETASLFFSISLAQWSLNRAFFGEQRNQPDWWQKFAQALDNDPDSVIQGELDPKNFPSIAKQQFGISAIEYVNTFFYAHAENTAYLNGLKQQCDDNGVSSQLIMCDRLGNLGDADEAARIKAVENHYKWVNAAKYLGCHSIRVNAAGQGTAEEVKAAAVDGLGRLSEYGAENGINIIVENHGGYSSDGSWLADVMKQVNSPNCGTLPDFGNFCITRGADGCEDEYDRYKGTKELMPYAKGVSAKAHSFDAEGNEKSTDFVKMLQIVKDAGFKGFVGIEFEGDELSEPDGINATKALLMKAGAQVS
ncbi:MAG: sugar phosphate isomerase/epimerase family protein [Cytophagales bacterium]|nr:sugar phosphate isomerase/epimerase family protein [Cytophagales bacterium]